MRRCRGGDRRAGAMGLARPFGPSAAGAWSSLCDLCWLVEEPVSVCPRRRLPNPLRSGRRDAELLCALRDAHALRAISPARKHSSRALQQRRRPRAALSYRHRSAAGLDLSRRKAGTAKGLSRRSVDRRAKEMTPRAAGFQPAYGASCRLEAGRTHLRRIFSIGLPLASSSINLSR